MNHGTLPVLSAHLSDMEQMWTENQILAALHRHLTSPAGGSWAAVAQVSASGGRDVDQAMLRRIDLLAVRLNKRTGNTLDVLAIEVKTSRSDYLRDLRDPAKQESWRRFATHHAYATPVGVIEHGEAPAGSGHIEVERLIPDRKDSPTTVAWIELAPANLTMLNAPLPVDVFAALMRRLSDAEAEAKGWGDPAPAGERQLRQDVARMRKELATARRRIAALEAKESAWKSAYATSTPDGLPCRWCGQPLKPGRLVKGGPGGWRHAAKADQVACIDHEAQGRVAEAKELYAAADPEVIEARLNSRRTNRVGGFDYDKEPWRAFYELQPRSPEPAA